MLVAFRMINSERAAIDFGDFSAAAELAGDDGGLPCVLLVAVGRFAF